jgi:hypothetical protein
MKTDLTDAIFIIGFALLTSLFMIKITIRDLGLMLDA